MVAELPGFGLAPGEEDRGNESEPELETSKMVQVGLCLMIGSLLDLMTNLCLISEGGKPEEEEVGRVPVDGLVPRSMARSDQEGVQGADTYTEEDCAVDYGRKGRGGNGEDWIWKNRCILAASLGEAQSP